MKVYAHKWYNNNEKIVVNRDIYTCTAPRGILSPQPKSAESIALLVRARTCALVDDLSQASADPSSDYVESNKVKAEVVVQTFSAQEDVAPKVADLSEMLEAAERVSEELADVQNQDDSDEHDPDDQSEGPENPDFANYSTTELMGLCDSLGIKVRKNASRATMISKLVEVSDRR